MSCHVRVGEGDVSVDEGDVSVGEGDVSLTNFNLSRQLC
jgi:hypothetical protein